MRPNGLSNNNNPSSSGIPTNYIPRNRLLSLNTPKLSPLQMVQSPFPMIGNNLFESNLNMANDYFKLEEVQQHE